MDGRLLVLRILSGDGVREDTVVKDALRHERRRAHDGAGGGRVSLHLGEELGAVLEALLEEGG